MLSRIKFRDLCLRKFLTYAWLKQILFSREFDLILQWIDSSANKSDFDDQRDSIIIKTFLRERRVCERECCSLHWFEKRLSAKNIYRGNFYYILKHMLCTLQQIWQVTRGFDDAKCYSRDSTAPQWVGLVRTRSEYHESSYIPHRGDWEIQAWFISCLANMRNMF